MSWIADSANLTSAGVLWGVLGFLLLSVVLYFTRTPAHRAIASLGEGVHGALTLAADAVVQGGNQLDERNREVLLEAGREASERIIEREFERIETVVQRDVSSIPSLDRRIKDAITRIEEDYQHSTEVPPEPPGWSNVVDAVAQVPAKGDPMVVQILEQIHTSLVRAQEKAITEYRSAIEGRHKHLKNMMPEWRKMLQASDQVEKKAVKLLERANTIDRHMENYENILQKTDRAVRALSTSSLHQFMVSALVLIIAIGGAVINFHLIARPMAEMVGGNSSIGGFKTSDIAAMVIILVEVSIGIFLMESLRITRLFPMIGALPDRIRINMIWITFSILLSLAGVEAGLAYMREILLQDELATNALLRGAQGGASAQFTWITTTAQMGMGFILPFALVFAAIPLENFIFSMRTVTGMGGAALMRGFAVLLRVSGGLFKQLCETLLNLYDMLVFGPLWLEGRFKGGGFGRPSKPSKSAPMQPESTTV